MPYPILVNEYETAWDRGIPAGKSATVTGVQTGDLFLVVAGAESNIDNAVPLTFAGGGYTWNRLFETPENPTGPSGYITSFYAVATSTGSFTYTVTKESSANFAHGANLFLFRGASGVPGARSIVYRNGAAPSGSIRTSGSQSALVVFNVDYNAGNGASRVWRSGAGPLAERTYFFDSSAYTVYAGIHTGVPGTGNYTFGLSAPGSQIFSLAAIEIYGLANSGGGGGGSTSHSGALFFSCDTDEIHVGAADYLGGLNLDSIHHLSLDTSVTSRGAYLLDGQSDNTYSGRTNSMGSLSIDGVSHLSTNSAKLSNSNFIVESISHYNTIGAKAALASFSGFGTSDSRYLGQKLVNATISQSLLSDMFMNTLTSQNELGQVDFAAISHMRFLANVISRGVTRIDATSHWRSLGGVSYEGAVEFPAGITINDYVSVDRLASLAFEAPSDMRGTSAVSHRARLDTSVMTDLYANTLASSQDLGALEFQALSHLMMAGLTNSRGSINLAGLSDFTPRGSVSYTSSFRPDSRSNLFIFGGLSQTSSLNFTAPSDFSISAFRGLGGIFTFSSNSDLRSSAAAAHRGVIIPAAETDLYFNPLGNTVELGSIQLLGSTELSFSPSLNKAGGFQLLNPSTASFIGDRSLGAIINMSSSSSATANSIVLRGSAFDLGNGSYLFVTTEIPVNYVFNKNTTFILNIERVLRFQLDD